MRDKTRDGKNERAGTAGRRQQDHPGGGAGARGHGGQQAGRGNSDSRDRVREVSDQVRKENRAILDRLATK